MLREDIVVKPRASFLTSSGAPLPRSFDVQATHRPALLKLVSATGVGKPAAQGSGYRFVSEAPQRIPVRSADCWQPQRLQGTARAVSERRTPPLRSATGAFEGVSRNGSARTSTDHFVRG
ncbi:MAG TPA: hypothetical protein DCQ98_01735 [Planctomycetaceae bacterium]|nr:hypothetical protein [Planctomycetaceae bacterium]